MRDWRDPPVPELRGKLVHGTHVDNLEKIKEVGITPGGCNKTDEAVDDVKEQELGVDAAYAPDRCGAVFLRPGHDYDPEYDYFGGKDDQVGLVIDPEKMPQQDCFYGDDQVFTNIEEGLTSPGAYWRDGGFCDPERCDQKIEEKYHRRGWREVLCEGAIPPEAIIGCFEDREGCELFEGSGKFSN